MAFDPDAYLAQPDTTAFDPDAYLAAGNKPSLLSRVGSALKGAGKTALDFASFVGQIGQPKAAQDFAASVAQPNAADSSQQDPNNPGNLLVSGLSAGMGTPNLPAPIAHQVAGAEVNAATSPMTYVGGLGELPWIKALMGAGTPEKAVTALASSTSKVPVTSLEAASTPAGRATLTDAAQGSPNFGADFKSATDNFAANLPEKQIVDQAIPKMGNVNIQPVIDALENAKPENPTGAYLPEQQVVADKIDRVITAIKGNPQNGQFFPTKYSAGDLLTLRRQLDSPIDYTTGLPEPKGFQDALFQGRTAAKNILNDAATATGNPEYTDAMKSYSDKLDALADARRVVLGNGPDISQDVKGATIGGNVGNPGNPASVVKLAAIQKFDDMAGTNFAQRAKQINQAQDFSDQNNPLGTGQASLAPQGGWWGAMRRVGGPTTIGATAGGGIGGMLGGGTGAVLGAGIGGTIGTGIGTVAEALASPGFATRAAIPAARAIANVPPYIRALGMAAPMEAAATSSLMKIANPDSLSQPPVQPNIPSNLAPFMAGNR